MHGTITGIHVLASPPPQTEAEIWSGECICAVASGMPISVWVLEWHDASRIGWKLHWRHGDGDWGPQAALLPFNRTVFRLLPNDSPAASQYWMTVSW